MKKSIFYFLLGFTLLIFTQCNKDKEDELDTTGTLALSFDLNYDGEDIDLFTQEKEYMDNSILITQFATYLSDGHLRNESDDLTLFDNQLLEFKKSGKETITLSIDGIPTGTYQKLSFGIGVEHDANSTIPQDHASGTPLNRDDFYWEAWGSYIFSKMEGKVSTTDGFSSFAYHTGANSSYRVKEFNTTIDIKGGETTTISITTDLKRVLKDGNSYYDLLELQNLHNEGDEEDMNQIADNIIEAMQINQD